MPIVLKGAFSAMGKVGGMLAGMGDSASKGVTGLARNSEGFQAAQRMGKERNNRIKAGLDKNGVLTGRGQRRLKRLNRLSRIPVVRGLAGGMTKRQASLMAQARKDIDASEDAAATLSGALASSGISKSKAISDLGFEAGTESAYYGGQFLEAASKGNITAMNAAIEAMRRSNMKPKDIARKELDDILPSYIDYIGSKRKSAMTLISDEYTCINMQRLCKEIKDFIQSLYTGTSSDAERNVIKKLIADLKEAF